MSKERFWLLSTMRSVLETRTANKTVGLSAVVGIEYRERTNSSAKYKGKSAERVECICSPGVGALPMEREQWSIDMLQAIHTE